MLRRRPLLAVLLVVTPALLPACQTYEEKLRAFRQAWGSSDYPLAEELIDELIADQADVDTEMVTRTRGLSLSIDAARGDTYLLLLEKAMVRLARGDPEATVGLLRRSRDELDRHYQTDTSSYVAATLLDDTALDYPGADYEHVMVRALLSVADLLAGGVDAYAYALQVGEKQEEIIGSPFGEAEGYQPRQSYRRVALGAYLQGLIKESNLETADAALAYQRALEYAPGNRLLEAAAARTGEGRYAPEGSGALHVFYLAGRGPYLVQGTAESTELSTRLAGLTIAIVGGAPSALVQAPVPVPWVVSDDPSTPPLSFDLGQGPVTTEVLLDVGMVAGEQLEANQPWIVGRAMIRRAIKSGVAATAEVATRRGLEQRGSDSRAAFFGFLVGAIINLFATSTERADTRNWTTLPSQFHVARLELPAGEYDFGVESYPGTRLRVAAGRDSILVVLRPNLRGPPVLLLDPYSQVAELEVAPTE